jgi:glycosyltransferase involved in cell wall biosynthesis
MNPGSAPDAAPPPPPPGSNYAGDLFSEIQRYAALASEIARNESFDVVHAHDWMTFPAGLAVAGIKGVPLVVHVHSTEFDRSGLHIDQRIYDIERRGMHGAIKVIAVSYLTKNQCTHHYGVDPAKVEVVYNAIEVNGAYDEEQYKIHKDEKIVLFLGRITMQKGPEYFLAAAKKVLEVMDNVSSSWPARAT